MKIDNAAEINWLENQIKFLWWYMKAGIKKDICFLSKWMEYDVGDTFTFEFEPNGIPSW